MAKKERKKYFVRWTCLLSLVLANLAWYETGNSQHCLPADTALSSVLCLAASSHVL
jgi:hypothetical protein